MAWDQIINIFIVCTVYIWFGNFMAKVALSQNNKIMVVSRWGKNVREMPKDLYETMWVSFGRKKGVW